VAAVAFGRLLDAVARRAGPPPRILFADGHDDRAVRAARAVAAAGWCEPSLLEDVDDPGATVGAVVARSLLAGDFDGAIVGATEHSRAVLAAGMQHLRGTGRVVGAAWVDAVSAVGRDVVFVDPSVNISPDPATLVHGIDAAARLFESVVGRPAVVGLASWGAGAHQHDARLDVVVAELAALGRPVSCGAAVQVDALLDADVAGRKGFGPGWAPADVIGFPDLQAANIATKVVEVLGGVRTCAFTMGFARPFNDVSRSTSVEGLVAAAAITTLQVDLLDPVTP
jgi:phosphotransacetylase